MTHHTPEFRDEIELIDILRVIWKWKYLILGGSVLCAVAAGVISFKMPKVYRINMVLRPGILQVNDNGKNTYIDSPQNIKAIIEAGTFDYQIMKDITDTSKNDFPKSLKINVTIPKDAESIVVSHEGSDVELGQRILNNLLKLLLAKYSEMVDYYHKQYETQIIMDKADIEKYNAQIRSDEQQIKNLNRSIDELLSEIKIVNKNTNHLISERDKFISDTVNPDTILSSVLYTNTIQQNIALSNTYNDQIKRYESEKEGHKVSLETAKGERQKLLESIKNLEFKKNSIQNIKLLQSPTPSFYPIKPRKRLNVALATIVGLFTMLLLSFFIEYIHGHKTPKINKKSFE